MKLRDAGSQLSFASTSEEDFIMGHGVTAEEDVKSLAHGRWEIVLATEEPRIEHTQTPR